MCRSIKPLFNFDPPVTSEDVRAASLQFVRKISGFNKPSKANEAAFLMAVDEIAAVSGRLIHSLETNAPPKNRAGKGQGSHLRESRTRVRQAEPLIDVLSLCLPDGEGGGVGMFRGVENTQVIDFSTRQKRRTRRNCA